MRMKKMKSFCLCLNTRYAILCTIYFIAQCSLPAVNCNAQQWMPLGPFGVPEHTCTDFAAGTGQIRAIAFDPRDPQNIIYVASPFGGLWKTFDGGKNWSNKFSNTDFLPVCAVADIAVNPKKPDIVYIATGEGYTATGNHSAGIYKSVDAGKTFLSTGLKFKWEDEKIIRRLIINPDNPDILFCASNDGVYRTQDAGETWKLVLKKTEAFYTVEFKPDNPNVVYASGKKIYRSKNGGKRWKEISTSFRSLDLLEGPFVSDPVQRINLAVTEADPDLLYAIVATEKAYHFFVFNTLAWQERVTPNDDPRRIPIVVSSSNPDEIYIGQTRIFKSTDGGWNWKLMNNYGQKLHPDIWALEYIPGTDTLCAGTDGGFYITDNGAEKWTELNDGLCLTMSYRIGGSLTNPNLLLVGNQDTGCNYYDGESWKQLCNQCGDGYEQVVDYTNDSILFMVKPNGLVARSKNLGKSWSSIINPTDDHATVYSPFMQHPENDDTIYIGRQHLWMSPNKMGHKNSWKQISDFTNDFCISEWQAIDAAAIAPSAPNTIYCALISYPPPNTEAPDSRLYKTTTGGGIGEGNCPDTTYWKDITPKLDVKTPVSANANIIGIAVSETDENKVWIVYEHFSMATSHINVKMSLDGGTTWKDYSEGLPPYSINCIQYQIGSNDALYIGTDIGCFYRNADMTEWTSFSDQLPNVEVMDMTINYATKKIRCCTYGRGIWECDLVRGKL